MHSSLFSSSQRMNNVHINSFDSFKKGICSHMHFHEAIEVLYTVKGSFSCTFSGEEVIRKPGDILFINSNVPHSTACLEDGSHDILVQFFNIEKSSSNLSYLSEFLGMTDINYYIFNPSHPDHDNMAERLTAMLKYKEIPDSYSRLLVISEIYAILALLQKNQLISCNDWIADQKSLRKIYPAFEYIDKNYSQHITLEELATVCGFNKVYFCNLFKQATGGTAIDFLNFVRVCKAEELLKQNMNVTEVAYLAGFSSPSYFNEIFKRYRMCSPSVYKKISSTPDKMFHDMVLDENTILFPNFT